MIFIVVVFRSLLTIKMFAPAYPRPFGGFAYYYHLLIGYCSPRLKKHQPKREMADAVILNTCELSTAAPRGQQPQAITPQQIKAVERTWKMVEGTESGLMDVGIVLFKQ